MVAEAGVTSEASLPTHMVVNAGPALLYPQLGYQLEGLVVPCGQTVLTASHSCAPFLATHGSKDEHPKRTKQRLKHPFCSSTGTYAVGPPVTRVSSDSKGDHTGHFSGFEEHLKTTTIQPQYQLFPTSQSPGATCLVGDVKINEVISEK